MSHIVVRRFCEKNHNDHVYEVGDTYPARGKKSTKARLKQLTTQENKYKKVYLKHAPLDVFDL